MDPVTPVTSVHIFTCLHHLPTALLYDVLILMMYNLIVYLYSLGNIQKIFDKVE